MKTKTTTTTSFQGICCVFLCSLVGYCIAFIAPIKFLMLMVWHISVTLLRHISPTMLLIFFYPHWVLVIPPEWHTCVCVLEKLLCISFFQHRHVSFFYTTTMLTWWSSYYKHNIIVWGYHSFSLVNFVSLYHLKFHCPCHSSSAKKKNLFSRK